MSCAESMSNADGAHQPPKLQSELPAGHINNQSNFNPAMPLARPLHASQQAPQQATQPAVPLHVVKRLLDSPQQRGEGRVASKAGCVLRHERCPQRVGTGLHSGRRSGKAVNINEWKDRVDEITATLAADWPRPKLCHECCAQRVRARLQSRAQPHKPAYIMATLQRWWHPSTVAWHSSAHSLNPIQYRIL